MICSINDDTIFSIPQIHICTWRIILSSAPHWQSSIPIHGFSKIILTPVPPLVSTIDHQRPWTNVSSHGVVSLLLGWGWELASLSDTFNWHHRPAIAQSRVTSPAIPCTLYRRVAYTFHQLQLGSWSVLWHSAPNPAESLVHP